MTMLERSSIFIVGVACALGLAASTLPACQVDDKSLGEPCSVIADDPEPNGPLWLPAAPCGESLEVATEARVRFEMTVDGVPAVDVAPGCARCSAAESFCPSPDAPHCCEGPGLCVGTIRIGPGESYDLQWRTYVYPKVVIPEGCTEASCSPGSECRAGRTVEAGAKVEMRLQAVVDCGPDGCGECPTGQTCELSSSSACEGVASIEAETNFDLVLDDSIVEIEFTA
jgi:hypothetical protein